MSGRPGQIKRAPMDRHQGRARMWQSMRMLRGFTVADVIATAEVTVTAATKYVRYLRAAGYLRCVRARISGRTGGHARYQLIRDTGPFAPRIGRHGVRDPNIEPTAREPTMTIPRSEYERALRCIALATKLRAFGPSDAIRQCAAQALEIAR